MKPQPKFQSYQEIGYDTIHRLTPVLIFFIMPSNAKNICLFFTLPLGDLEALQDMNGIAV